MIRKFIIIILLSWFAFQLGAVDASKTIDQYVEENWTTAAGLPGNSVVAVGQTENGYLWVATRRALCRFDGTRFVVRSPFSTGQTGNEEITAMDIDRDGVIRLGSRGRGLLKYRDRIKVFEFITQKDGLSSNLVNSLYHDLKNNLWIGTDDGYLNAMSETGITRYEKKDGLGEPHIHTIQEDSRGNVWIGTRGGGLYRFINGRFEKTPVKDFDTYDVTAIREDSSGDLWIGTNRGLVRFDGENAELFETTRGLSGYTIYKILEDSDRNLWVGTAAGLYRIRRGRSAESAFRIERTMEGGIVRDIFEDRDKSIWIATDGRGLTRLRDGKIITFSTESGLPNEYVVFMHEDRDKNLRVGTMDGLVRFDKGNLNRESMTVEFTDAVVGPICEGPDKSIWFGTYGSGLYRMKNRQLSHNTIRDGLVSDSIISLYHEPDGPLWIGTASGLNSFEKDRFKSYTETHEQLKNEIYCIYHDKNDTLWFGTNKSIVREKDGVFSEFARGKLPDNLMVSYLHEDGNGILWAATKGSGLLRIENENKIATFTTAEGLYSNIIYQVFEDRSGYLWMSSDKGIFKVVKKELDDLAAKTGETGGTGGTTTIDHSAYGPGDGMKSRECSRWGQHSSIQTGDGKLLFGTPKGISIIDPQNIKINTVAPSVVIDKIVLNNREIEFQETKVLFRGFDYIQFFFSASTLISPQRVTFEYKLENKDTEWRRVKANQIKMAHYSALERGEYTFRVRAANSDNIWSENDAVFTFIYKPGFTSSMLFKFILVLLVLLLGTASFFFYKKYRTYRKVKNKYKDSTLEPEVVENCMKKLVYAMDIEMLYKNDSLSLQSLSKKIGVTSHILSQVVNEQMSKNFSDFVNGYRIEESKKMLQAADEDTSILHICYEVGFNSKSAFYRAFKKFTDMTPSQYQKTLK